MKKIKFIYENRGLVRLPNRLAWDDYANYIVEIEGEIYLFQQPTILFETLKGVQEITVFDLMGIAHEFTIDFDNSDLASRKRQELLEPLTGHQLLMAATIQRSQQRNYG